MGRGGQSPPGVDHSPLRTACTGRTAGGVTLASQQIIRDVLSPPLLKAGHPGAIHGFTQAAVDANAEPAAPGRRGI